MENDQLKSIVESLIFVSEGGVTVDRMGQVLGDVDKKEVLAAVEEIQSEYETQGRGFRIVEVAGLFQMRTPKENAESVKDFLRGKPARMSRAILETLAIVAYKQPVTRPEIEGIRGVDVSGVLATLQDRNLVRIVGRKDVPGRPFLYGTTHEFLEMFNLKDLGSLPTLKEADKMTLPAPPDEGEQQTESNER
jgi:segregation and condensation protein B